MAYYRKSKVIREGPLDIASSLKDLLRYWRLSKDRIETIGDITRHSTGDASEAEAEIKNKAEQNKADGLCIRKFPYKTKGDPDQHYCVYGVMYQIKQEA